MSAFKFYLSVLSDAVTYSDFIEITDDVLANSVGNLKQNLASNEYDIGTIKFNKISVNLRNEKARYSQANNPLSIFNVKRDEAILKIEWDRNADTIWCGNFPCGLSYLSAPIIVYKGLLEDNSSKFDADQQIQTFNFLGLESIIGKVQVDYASLSVSDDIRTTVFNILNNPKITKFLTVDQSNINVNNNFTPDAIASLKDKTCLEVLDELLFLSGAVLYVNSNDEIIVESRLSDEESKFTFYGPSSDLGIENLHDLSAHSLGLNRTFNFWKWTDTDITQSFQDSIDTYGFREKEISSDLVTNPITQASILNKLLNEFAFPKIEFDITVPMTSEITNEIFLLDKIKVDYPADYREGDSDVIPARYGVSRYGESSYITSNSSLIIDVAKNWKILNRNVSVKSDKITFKVREI